MPVEMPWPCDDRREHGPHHYGRPRPEPVLPWMPPPEVLVVPVVEFRTVAHPEYCPGYVSALEPIRTVIRAIGEAAVNVSRAFGGFQVVASTVEEYEDGRIDRTVTLENGQKVSVDANGDPID